MDVVWGTSGPVLLIETPTGAVVHAVGGFDTEVTVPAATTVTPAALVTRAGQFWVAGTTVVAGDSDAFLARVDGTGGGLRDAPFRHPRRRCSRPASRSSAAGSTSRWSRVIPTRWS